MKPSTQQEKEAKTARRNLSTIHTRVKVAWSNGGIKNWEDVFKYFGQTPTGTNKTGPLNFTELKEYLQAQTDALEARLSQELQSNVPTTTENLQTSPDTSNPVSPTSERVEAVNVQSDDKRVETHNNVSVPVVSNLEVKFDANNDYGLIPSKNENVFLYWFQKKAAAEALDKIVNKGYRGILVLAATGYGKTFIVGAIDRRLIDMDFHEGKTFSHIPRLYITKSTILEQTGRVLSKFFNIKPNVETEVINIEQLRSKAGQMWVQRKVKHVGGDEVEYFEWKYRIQPRVIYLDESQGVKNKKATQTQIIHAYNALPDNTCLISISATPFTRVSEAQAFAVSTHRPLEHLGFPTGSILTNETWPAYAAIISAPSVPSEYNAEAVKRLMDDLEDYVIRVRGVKPQFEAANRVEIIPFETEEKQIFYGTAHKRFLKEKAKIDAAVAAGDNAGICYLVILLKFAMAAEFCHAEYWARKMYEDVSSGKHAAVCAVKFKQTLIEIVRILNEKYGVSRDDISLVWGGGQTKLTKEQKAKNKLKQMESKLKEMGIDYEDALSSMGLEDVEDREEVNLPEHLRLGPQSMDQRQDEIDKFQSGRSLYCIYTLKSGGVGLSLHHTDDYIPQQHKKKARELLTTSENKSVKKVLSLVEENNLTDARKQWHNHGDKFGPNERQCMVMLLGCRRKESGYAFEEDIPFVPIRPRKTYVTVTYNAIELVQGVGRVPRLTSLSETEQVISCYAGTVEIDMAKIYTQKLRCLSAVVKQRESWQECMLGSNRTRFIEETIKKTENETADESSLIDEGETEEEEGEE